MKYRFSFVITLWWVLLLGFLGGMIIWLAPKEERVSEAENRNLSGAPVLSFESILDSSYMSGTENFLSDGFFLRGKLIELSSNMKSIFVINTSNNVLDVDMEKAVNEFMDEAEEGDSKESELKDNKDIKSIDFQENETIESEIDEQDQIPDNDEYIFWLDFTDGSTRTVYTYPKDHLDTSIEALNEYREVLPEDGELHFFQIPYGYLANLIIYDDVNKYTGWGCNAEEYMQQRAIEGVYIHNGPEILEPYLLDGELLYYRTDYHWSALGAYYGHEGIRKNQGLPYTKYEDYDYKVYEQFLGSIYRKDPSSKVKSMADRLEVMYPLFPTASYKIDNLTEQNEAPLMYYNLNSYLAFVGGTVGPYRRFVTGADTGRKVIIVTDSFGNAFAPYLFAYYDEVHMVDLRPAYYNKYIAGASVREYLEYYEIDDAYIMLSTSSSMNSGYMLNYLTKYLDD